jgi:hypothetical protein
MITLSELTPAQSKWLALIKHYFADIHSSGIITYQQLVEAHKKFTELRETDKKFKVGWPIWFITNNQISRGVYQLPKELAEQEVDPDTEHPLYAEYIDELKRFNIVK